MASSYISDGLAERIGGREVAVVGNAPKPACDQAGQDDLEVKQSFTHSSLLLSVIGNYSTYLWVHVGLVFLGNAVDDEIEKGTEEDARVHGKSVIQVVLTGSWIF